MSGDGDARRKAGAEEDLGGLEEARALLSRGRERVRDLRARYLRSEARLSELRAREEAHRRRVEELAAAVAARGERIAALERERDALREELGRLRTSRLWRWGTAYWNGLRALGLLGRAPASLASGARAPLPPPAAPPPSAPGPAEEDDPLPEDFDAPRRPGPGGPAFDVVCLPIIDWGFRFQRPQQLLSRLAARGHRVFYVCQELRPDGPAARLRAIRPNVWEVSLRGPRKNVYRDDLAPDEAATLLSSLDVLRREAGLGATLTLVQLPFWEPLAALARERFAWPVVYDCMDHHAGFSTNEDAMLARERKLLSEADLVVVSSRFLEREASPYARRLVRVPNACDYDTFATVGAPVPKAAPVIGYYGAIADWFDSDLVADLAERRPDWSFLLVGSTFTADLSRLSALPNVELPGEVPYAELPSCLARMDVLLIPFRRTPLTEATNPVKAYEILAAGRPLVSVPLPEVEALGDLVRLAGTAEEMEREVAAALAGDGPGERERRRAFARGETWEHRAAELAPHLREAFPKVSVVVVTWQNLEWNARCLASLRERSEWPNLEVIAVDNGSTDGTPGLLREEAARDPRVRVVLNDENAGFAAANNQGLAVATGDVLVLLNNDTVVTRGALAALVRHLRRDGGLGLVGPTTNEIGNESKVEVGYSSFEELHAWAARFVRAHDGELLEMPMLAMFCVALTRRTWELAGALDEQFETGMFEDDDYSRRVRDLGLRVGCVRDAFVHHRGQASFDTLDRARYLEIFGRNRARFERKWGPWTPHLSVDGLRMIQPFRLELARLVEEAGTDPTKVAVVLPTIGWDIALVQRPHHLARALARRGWFVVFDCSNSEAEDFGGFRKVEEGLFLFKGSVEILTGLESPLLWTLPYNAALVERFPTPRVVYDCIDDLAVFPYPQAVLRRAHEKMLAEADVVACVSRPLLEECRRARPDALYLPNGVDAGHFARAGADEPPAALRPALAPGRPVAGYYGAIASWLDVDLVAGAARLRPDWTFVLIGQRLADAPPLEPLERLPNVHVLPPQPYAELPSFLARFDVAFIPFVVNAITHATSPLKLFEFFAGGKPVISTPMPECAAFPEVRIVPDAAGLAAALDGARRDGSDTRFLARLRAIARRSSWSERVALVESRLNGPVRRPEPREPRRATAAAGTQAPGPRPWNGPFADEGRRLEGTCLVCGERTHFTYSDPRLLRESLVCAACGATSRYRAIARGLLRAAAQLAGAVAGSLAGLVPLDPGRRLRVFDTQQAFRGTACAYAVPEILGSCRWIDLEVGVHRPADRPGLRYGEGLSNQDLEHLTFDDAAFDVVVTSDVMEHVRLDGRAHAEVHRVLAPGGVYLFTVPSLRDRRKTLVRRRVVDPDDPSRDEDLLPREYHGDANDPEGGALAYRAYGTELDEVLGALGFDVEFSQEDLPAHALFSSELFYCTKRPRHGTERAPDSR